MTNSSVFICLPLYSSYIIRITISLSSYPNICIKNPLVQWPSTKPSTVFFSVCLCIVGLAALHSTLPLLEILTTDLSLSSSSFKLILLYLYWWHNVQCSVTGFSPYITLSSNVSSSNKSSLVIHNQHNQPAAFCFISCYFPALWVAHLSSSS